MAQSKYLCMGKATNFDRDREVWLAFSQRQAELTYQGQLVRASTRGLWMVSVGGFKYIEQNPNKPSWCAQRAREGRKFIWVIREADNLWVGYLEDGFLYIREDLIQK